MAAKRWAVVQIKLVTHDRYDNEPPSAGYGQGFATRDLVVPMGGLSPATLGEEVARAYADMIRVVGTYIDVARQVGSGEGVEVVTDDDDDGAEEPEAETAAESDGMPF